jgi:AcrR family transcriptional regulator
MMSASVVIMESFKDLLRTTPYRQITVAQICAKAGVSRKTFYCHFVDKQDIVEKQFRADILTPIIELQSLLPMMDIKSSSRLVLERFYQSFYNDRVYYQNLLAMMGRSDFVQTIAEEISKTNASILSGFDLPAVERDYLAYFSASSQAMLLLKWLLDGMKLTPKQMAGYFEKWVISSWKDAAYKGASFNR